jgi:hypothetical protein
LETGSETVKYDRRIFAYPSCELVDPFDMPESHIRIDDICNSLSLICRYNGHIGFHYSVLDHSVNVAQIAKEYFGVLDSGLLMLHLLHDAEEAYLGDMPRPYKNRYPQYVKDGDNLRKRIWDKFVPGWANKYTHAQLSTIHEVDIEVYYLERDTLFIPDVPAPIRLRPNRNRYDVMRDFMDMYKEYSSGISKRG